MIQTLIKEILRKDAPVCVGLDPMLSYVPQAIVAKHLEEEGPGLQAAAAAIEEYNYAIIDAVCDLVPAVKPQIAMYEQFGLPGLAAFAKTCAYAREKGLVVIGDIKRGDIGSTSEAYALGHLGGVKVGEDVYEPFAEDFITVNPYLGSDGILPFIKVAKEKKKGMFVLVKTSNPSSGEFQDLVVDGKPLYEHVAQKVRAWGEEHMGEDYSYVGAVVGATYPEMAARIRKILPKNFILVPGYGAQGGTGKDLAPFFNEDGLGAVVNSSRGIICAYKQEAYSSYGEEHFAEAAREAAKAMIKDIAAGRAGGRNGR